MIVDFAGFEGQVLTLMNSAETPSPNGLTPDPFSTGRVMEFRLGQSNYS